MSWSANEVQALATKAARGGGAPAGQADLFGRAAVCHLMAGRNADDLGVALRALPRGPIIANPLALTQALEAADGCLTIQSSGPELVQSYAETLPFMHEISATPEGVQIKIQRTKPNPRKTVCRLMLPPDLVVTLNKLAARILVPESEASRLGGAGAGLTDND